MRVKRWPRWARWLIALVLAGAVTFGALLCAVLYGSYDHIKGEPETMLILGCQVMPWGPSVLLQDRLDEAIAYLEEHPDMTVIVSGGQGPDEHISEAKCMRDVLVKAGVSEEQIFLEDQSHNTYQNIVNSVKIMKDLEIETGNGVLVVSNGFHLTRVRMLWERVSEERDVLSTLAAPASHMPSRLRMYIREPLALVRSFFLDR